jgi:hypothetical protein
MSCNEDLDHVHVLPEDAANSELANGFARGLSQAVSRQLYVHRVAGGWIKVLEQFKSFHISEMDTCARRFMILLIDFDDRPVDRLNQVKEGIPDRLAERVFVLGVRSEPEALKKALKRVGLGSYLEIGGALARDCRDESYETWQHELLRHNAAELDRLRTRVRPILFPPI